MVAASLKSVEASCAVGVDAGPAPEHDALEAGVAVQRLLRLLVGLLVIAVLRLGPLRLVDGQVAACMTHLVIGTRKIINARVVRGWPPSWLCSACSGNWQNHAAPEFRLLVCAGADCRAGRYLVCPFGQLPWAGTEYDTEAFTAVFGVVKINSLCSGSQIPEPDLDSMLARHGSPTLCRRMRKELTHSLPKLLQHEGLAQVLHVVDVRPAARSCRSPGRCGPSCRATCGCCRSRCRWPGGWAGSRCRCPGTKRRQRRPRCWAQGWPCRAAARLSKTGAGQA